MGAPHELSVHIMALNSELEVLVDQGVEWFAGLWTSKETPETPETSENHWESYVFFLIMILFVVLLIVVGSKNMSRFFKKRPLTRDQYLWENSKDFREIYEGKFFS